MNQLFRTLELLFNKYIKLKETFEKKYQKLSNYQTLLMINLTISPLCHCCGFELDLHWNAFSVEKGTLTMRLGTE